MIIGIIHKGSGLGDQLFSYIATRVRAADLGVDFGFVGKEFFKGASFMNLNWGEKTDVPYVISEPSGALVIPQQVFKLDKPYYDPEFNFIEDGTVIDGYGAQDIRYFEHRLGEIREWLKVQSEPFDFGDTCVVNFRGGEYQAVPDLFLPIKYWQIAFMNVIDDAHEAQFVIHTDDPKLAREFLGDYVIVSDIEKNWRAIRYAEHLILSNSAFGILPALLNDRAKKIYAPKFWAGRNVSEWRRPGNYYKKFTYV